MRNWKRSRFCPTASGAGSWEGLSDILNSAHETDFWTSDLHDYNRISCCCCFKPLVHDPLLRQPQETYTLPLLIPQPLSGSELQFSPSGQGLPALRLAIHRFLRFVFGLDLFFYFRIIALQYCVGFCHTIMWISHESIYTPSLWSLLANVSVHPSPLSPRALSWTPCVI